MGTASRLFMPTRRDPSVGPGEVHLHLLWNVEDRDPPVRWLSSLPPGEREEARGMASETRRREFLWSRLLLRRGLASYLGERESRLPFRKGALGKPFLKGGNLHFSLSHTQGLIACSFAQGPVGIDVQATLVGSRALHRAQLVAHRYFSGPEIAHLESCPPEERALAFTRIFCLKEAHAKALGDGLALPGRGFTVPLSLSGMEIRGRWGYLGRTLRDGVYCLAHAARSSEPLRYRWRHWKRSELSPEGM